MSVQHKLKGMEKFNRVKGAMAAAALGVVTMVAPLKGHAAEATPDKEPMTASETANVRQQQFEAAVRAGLPPREIAKYVDFPAFVPTTKDGQFDEKKAKEIAKKLKPYWELLAEKGETISAVEAYKAFKESMGETDMSLEDFEQLKDVASKAMKDKPSVLGMAGMSGVAAVLFAIGLLAALIPVGALADNVSRRGLKKGLKEFCGDCVDSWPFMIVAAIAAVSTIPTSAMTIAGASGAVRHGMHPETPIFDVYQKMYNAHLDSTIKRQQKTFHMVEWEQAKSMLPTNKTGEKDPNSR